MEKQEYILMHQLQNTHWWFYGKRKIFFSLFEKYTKDLSKDVNILDIGCGDGSFILDINKRGFKNTWGVDFADEAIEYCQLAKVDNIDEIDVEQGLPFREKMFDVLVMLDSLEHIKNEHKIITEMNRVLKPGGIAFINVPAYQFLWSYHDEYLHHQRRYNRRNISALIKSHGFTIKRFTFTNFFTLPPAILVRLLKKVIGSKQSDTKKHNKLINWTLKRVFDFEVLLLRFLSLPCGLSIFTVIVKNDK